MLIQYSMLYGRGENKLLEQEQEQGGVDGLCYLE